MPPEGGGREGEGGNARNSLGEMRAAGALA